MLSESLHFAKGLAPAADRFNTNPATDVYSLADAQEITFLVIHQGGTTGKATLTVEACDNVTPSNTAAVAFRMRKMVDGVTDAWGAITDVAATGADTDAAADTIVEVNVKASELPAGKPFVRLKCTEAADDPVNACVVAVLHGLRYGGATQPGVLS